MAACNYARVGLLLIVLIGTEAQGHDGAHTVRRNAKLADALQAMKTSGSGLVARPSNGTAPGGLLGDKDVVLFMHSAKTGGISMRNDATKIRGVKRCGGVDTQAHSFGYLRQESSKNQFFYVKQQKRLSNPHMNCNYVEYPGGIKLRNMMQDMLNSGQGGAVRHFMFVRDPVSRAISGLEHFCRHHNLDPRVELKRFADTGKNKGYSIDNWTTRLLSVTKNETKPDLSIAKKMVDTALFFGQTEYYPQSWCMLAYFYGAPAHQCEDTCSKKGAAGLKAHLSWSNADEKSKNPACGVPYTAKERHFIADANKLDVQLHKYAVNKWNELAKRIEKERKWKLICD